jgi:hypothetical protein
MRGLLAEPASPCLAARSAQRRLRQRQQRPLLHASCPRLDRPDAGEGYQGQSIVIYTVHVNTDGDPTSAVLQYCASGSDRFSTVTSSRQIATALGPRSRSCASTDKPDRSADKKARPQWPDFLVFRMIDAVFKQPCPKLIQTLDLLVSSRGAPAGLRSRIEWCTAQILLCQLLRPSSVPINLAIQIPLPSRHQNPVIVPKPCLLRRQTGDSWI